MAIDSGFFSDGSEYNQEQFSDAWEDLITNGVVANRDQSLNVFAETPNDMSVYVSKGKIWINGFWGAVEDASYNIVIPDADGSNPRIDRIIARLSRTTNQSITFVCLEGTPAGSPVAPTLTQTTETYEISLAQVAVGAGVVSISDANITDERTYADPADTFYNEVSFNENITVPTPTADGHATTKAYVDSLGAAQIILSNQTVDASANDRDAVYYDGTKWAQSEGLAQGFYDETNDVIVLSGNLDGFTGLSAGSYYISDIYNAGGLYLISDVTSEVINFNPLAFAISSTEIIINPGTGGQSSERVVQYTSSGTFTVPLGISSINALIVAGGGAGAGYQSNGGGGAGGVIYETSIPVTPYDNMSVVVGAGGAGNISATGSNGSNSSFAGYTAIGGGGGGASEVGSSGGSGGGGGGANAGGTGTSGQGFAGGAGTGASNADRGGGGGGASEVGQDGGISTGGNGGDGVDYSAYIGTSYGDSGYFGGGGGGGSFSGGGGTGGLGGGANGASSSTTSNDADPNTGGGGGGSGDVSTTPGGDGGSGTVIIWW